METSTNNSRWLNMFAFVIALPATYFICSSILKFSLGFDWPYNTGAPLLEKWGLREQLGWNINGLIIFGPFLAFLIALLQIVRIKWSLSKEEIDFRLSIKRKTFPISLLLLSGFALAILFVYAVIENL